MYTLELWDEGWTVYEVEGEHATYGNVKVVYKKRIFDPGDTIDIGEESWASADDVFENKEDLIDAIFENVRK